MIGAYFFDIAHKFPISDDIIEKAFSGFVGLKCRFAGRLDALLLSHRIDLIKLQKDCGIYLTPYRDISAIVFWIGSMELAQKYIDELPTSKTIDCKLESKLANINTTQKDIDNEICTVPSIEKLICNNWNIPDSILDTYYQTVQQPKSIEDIPSGYIGKLNRFYSPFLVSVYGAPIQKTEWDLLEIEMNDSGDHNKDYTKESVYDALKNYAKGFQYGYDNFIKDKVETDLLSDTADGKAKRIKDFLSSISLLGFSKTYGNGRGVFDGWYDNGISAGYYYRAWYLIFENYELFDTLFFRALPSDNLPIQINSQNEDLTDSTTSIENSNNPPAEKQKIDIEKLKDYFVPSFKGMGNNINYFDNLINDLATIKGNKEIAQIAYMIYTGKKMNNRRPNMFSDWYKIFCGYTGTKLIKSYKPCKLIPSKEMEKLFNYLK